MPLEKPGFSRCSIGTSCSPVLRASDHGPVLDNPEGSLTVFAVGADHVFAVTELGEARAAARLLIDLGLFGEVIRAARIDLQSPRPTLSAGDGAYLVTLAGCTFCHGAHLRGGQGPEPGAPGGPDLTRTGALRSWTEADFAMALRTGLTASGHPINPKYMPWLGYRHMSDAEIALVWQYLQAL